MNLVKKLLVLEPFSNGHAAADAFVAMLGWLEGEYEVRFCGSHANLLQELTTGPAYAVVPVHNTISGEVEEVTKTLAGLREKGYELQVRAELELQVNHCLMAPQDMTAIERVMSKEQAIKQCGQFLDWIDIPPDHRSKKDSTGNAARAVAKMGPRAKMAAIAPRAAAEEYGLRIIAENIQDVPDNKTKFLLLENEALVRPVTVAIIGGRGRFGNVLTPFYEQLGCTVIVSDKNKPRELRQAEVVEKADVVIFCVPIKETPAIIRSLLPYMREGQLLLDVTSVKGPAIEAMLESKAQVVGLHPMFRPEVFRSDTCFDGQTIVTCPARLTTPEWRTWVVNMLAATRAKIKWSSAVEHDGYMTIVQGLSHLGNLASAVLITEAGISVVESLTYASPFYRILLALMGRLVSQDPDLYASIMIENPQTLGMLDQEIAIKQRLRQMILEKDYAGLRGLFEVAKAHFGREVVKDADESFTRILSVFSTLYGSNSITLEINKSQDRPGLGLRLLEPFSRRGINITGWNTVLLDGLRLQFTISLGTSPSSDDARRALEEIGNWPDPKVKILA